MRCRQTSRVGPVAGSKGEGWGGVAAVLKYLHGLRFGVAKDNWSNEHRRCCLAYRGIDSGLHYGGMAAVLHFACNTSTMWGRVVVWRRGRFRSANQSITV